ncbi:MAG: hypothetical protein K0R61_5018 [Microvirga sp.]|jgi:hypothetical protein|nr:hypothetical protein [Rhodospirillales bacterium]MDF2974568.1 hypothetical protein [Microvirga sp.]
MGKLAARAFDLSSIMRAAHAEVQGQLAGLRRGAAAGYTLAKSDLASFDYRKRFARALSNAWAERTPPRAVDGAEFASSFTGWAGERGQYFVSLAA